MENNLKSRADGKTILIVDDEPSLLEVLDLVLTDAGFTTISAHDVMDALKRLEERKPDLVFTDYMMPVQDGSDLIEAMRANPKFADIPIIVTSGLSEKTISGRVDGYQAFVSKPWKAEAIIDSILRLLECDPKR
jgi:CheY-like chemotaxis protein